MFYARNRLTSKRYAKAVSWFVPDHAMLRRTNLLTPLQEQFTREVKLPADEEFLIRRLLHYCYLTGYKDEPYTDEIDPPPQIKAPAYVNRLHLNAQMYAIADKYDIPSLKEEAARKFDAVILELKENQSMKTHTGAGLFDQMMEAIPCIYSSTPDGDHHLRDRAREVIHHIFRKHPWPPILPTLIDNDLESVIWFVKIPSLRVGGVTVRSIGYLE